jgi:hypothetical protein
MILLHFGCVQRAARFATLLGDFLGVLRTRFRAAPPLPQSSCSRAVSTALPGLSAIHHRQSRAMSDL